LIKFTRIDVRGRIVRRWLCGSLLVLPRLFKKLTFDTLLKKSYSRLYQNATLKDLSGSLSHPEFHILATSLTTGGVCKFTSEGFIHFDRGNQEKIIRNSSLPLSIAVAASSAFPPLFPPVAISRELLNADSRDFDKTQYLTDGGVFDNLGLHELSRLAKQKAGTPWQSLIVSDAGGNFDWTIGNRYAFIVSRNVRATDILMDRVSKLVPSAISDRDLPLRHVYIGREVSQAEVPDALPPEVQRSVRNIRTDLDSFSMPEIRALIKHGYEVARFSLRACGLGLPLRGNALTWNRIADSQNPSRKQIEIEDAKRRRLRLFAIRDPATWLLVLLVLTWAAPFAWMAVNSYRQAHEVDYVMTVIYNLRGTVRDDSGHPIPGVLVSVSSARMPRFGSLTDASGEFKANPSHLVDAKKLMSTPPMSRGIAEIAFDKEGYQREVIDVAGAVPPPMEIVLHKVR
jgi:predicted acylesterase/phospholipase RssA